MARASYRQRYRIHRGSDRQLRGTAHRIHGPKRWRNDSIISHYPAAERDQLIEAANKVSATESRAPTLTILKEGRNREKHPSDSESY